MTRQVHKGQPWILPLISEEEIQRRHQTLREEMARRDIGCLIVAGNQGNYGGGGDHVRYLSNYGIYYGEGYLVFPLSGEIRMFCRSLNQAINFQSVSPISKHVSSYPTFSRDVTNYVKDLKLDRGNIGIVGGEVMPANFFLDLQQKLSGANLLFVTEILLEMRFIKGAEELAFVEKAGEIADCSYEAILRSARPGRKEYEVYAAVDEALTAHGANSPSFILLCSGPSPIFPYTPSSHRTLKFQDTILEEISPCYGGLWVQWGRPFTIGKPDNEMRELYKVAMEVYQFVHERIKPGVTFEGLIKAAHDLITKNGYTWMAPAIQFVGLDCTEMAYMTKGTPKNVELVPRPMDKRPFEPGSVIVNQPSVVTKDLRKGTLIIDTVIVTQDGCKPVTKAPLEYAQI